MSGNFIQVAGLILFFVVFLQLLVALSVYLLVTLREFIALANKEHTRKKEPPHD